MRVYRGDKTGNGKEEDDCKNNDEERMEKNVQL